MTEIETYMSHGDKEVVVESSQGRHIHIPAFPSSFSVISNQNFMLKIYGQRYIFVLYHNESRKDSPNFFSSLLAVLYDLSILCKVSDRDNCRFFFLPPSILSFIALVIGDR